MSSLDDFGRRLEKNLRHIRKWRERHGVTCFRVYDRDLPEYPLALDVYEKWLHVQEFESKAAEETSDERRNSAIGMARDLLKVDASQVFVKVRRKQQGLQQYEKLEDSGPRFEIQEGGLRFLANFTDYLDTGIFLDHRATRARIRDESAGKRFLNLFCYTATASVYAAAGGAAATVSVDLSRSYLDWARRNFKLNHLDGPQHELVQADCLTWLVETPDEFDLVFLDPPTFSNSKRMRQVFDVQKDHVKLIRDSVRRLADGGTLYFSNNFKKFRLDQKSLSDLEVKDIARATQPKDFERQLPHHCWRIRRP